MIQTDLKSTLSTLTDEELIKRAGEMLGGILKHDDELGWFLLKDGGAKLWNPLESLDNAFELVDFLRREGMEFELKASSDSMWLALFRFRGVYVQEGMSGTRAIVKASLLAWEYWKGVNSKNE